MSTTMKLSAAQRQAQTKGAARRERRAGRIPAVVYGHGQPAKSVSLDSKEFAKLLRDRRGTVVIELDVAEDSSPFTIIREIQREPLSGQVLHVDLQEVSMDEVVHVEVPVHLIGTPLGVKRDGGILEFHQRSLQVACLPGKIPSHIDLDVSELVIGKSLHASDVEFEEGVDLATDPKSVVASIAAPRLIQEDEPEEEEEAGDAEGEEGGDKAEAKEGEEPS